MANVLRCSVVFGRVGAAEPHRRVLRLRKLGEDASRLRPFLPAHANTPTDSFSLVRLNELFLDNLHDMDDHDFL